MTDYLKNTILNFDRKEYDTYSIQDYSTKNVSEIIEFIDSFDNSFFSWYQVQDNDKLERISQELYGNPDYWDILLLLNGKTSFSDMPYDFDTISEFAEGKAQDYIDKVYGDLPINVMNILINDFQEEIEAENEKFKILKIVKQSKINEFLQKLYEVGYV